MKLATIKPTALDGIFYAVDATNRLIVDGTLEFVKSFLTKWGYTWSE
jgi:hypothetical protein